MKKLFFWAIPILALTATILLQTCGDREPIKKTVTGKAGEVVVVTDKALWEGEPGAALRNVLAKDYPMLPQREPSFNLINIPKSAFNDLFHSHRNIVILLADSKIQAPKISIERNKWAKPQIVVFIEAPSAAEAATLISGNEEMIFNAIDQIEKDRIIRNTKRYEEAKLRLQVSEMFGGSPYFPNGFVYKKAGKEFMWVAYETTYTNQGVLIYTIPCPKKGVMPSLSEIIEAENRVLKENVPGMFDDSYMTIATSLIPPVIKNYKYKGYNFSEMRGFWEVANDYMGGPLVEHLFLTKEGDKVLVLQGFVYAPKYKKRNYLRQVEAILYSFEWL